METKVTYDELEAGDRKLDEDSLKMECHSEKQWVNDYPSLHVIDEPNLIIRQPTN